MNACAQDTVRPTNVPLPLVTATNLPGGPTPTATLPIFTVIAPTVTPAPTSTPPPTNTPVPTPKPTPPPPPTPTYRPTATPAGQLPVVPPYPGNKPDEAARLAANWLNSQPDAKAGKDPKILEVGRDRLKTLLLAWKATGPDVPVELADLDGSGQTEMITTFVDNWRSPNATALDYGSVMVLRATKDGWSPSPVLRASSIKPDAKEDFVHPTLLKLQDLNKDNKIEIVFSEFQCGASTCATTVYVVNWLAGKWISLAPKPFVMTSADVSFENGSDGYGGIVLFGGISGVAGAGLQRQRTEYYRWDKASNSFKLAETRYENSPFLYFRVIDGNAAAEKGNYSDAINLYNDALNTPTLKIWANERGAAAAAINQEKLSLTAFARFRLAITNALQNDRETAQSLLQEAASKDGVYGGWAQSFASVYNANKSATVKDGCAAVTKFNEQNPNLLEPLNQFGSNNPTFKAEDICPFK